MAMKKSFKKSQNVLLLFALIHMALYWPTDAIAYLTVGESAEIMPASEYRFGFEPQLFINQGGGGNLGAYFDAQVSESSSVRAGINSGKVDFNLFGSYKYIPFPDVDKQPALGFRFGAGYSRLESDNLFLLQFTPLMSKKTSSIERLGDTVPYFALPFTYTSGKSESYVASNLTFGLEITPSERNTLYWNMEISFNLNRSYSYISGAVIIPIDSRRRP